MRGSAQELVEHGLAAAIPRVPRRDDEDQLVGHQGPGLEPAVPRVGPHDAHVDLAVQDGLDDPARVRDLERDGDARVPLAKATDDGRQHVLARDRARAHQERAGDLAEELVERLTRLGPEQEHLPRVAVEELPGSRRHGLPAQAVEQPRAQLLLEEPHVLAHGGLGEAEGGGGPGEAPELVHSGEDLELAEVHEAARGSRQASAPRARASSRKRWTFRSLTSS